MSNSLLPMVVVVLGAPFNVVNKDEIPKRAIKIHLACVPITLTRTIHVEYWEFRLYSPISCLVGENITPKKKKTDREALIILFAIVLLAHAPLTGTSRCNHRPPSY